MAKGAKAPEDVLARQRAERRAWAALEGLPVRDAEVVIGMVSHQLGRRREEQARLDAEKYQAEARAFIGEVGGIGQLARRGPTSSAPSITEQA